MRVREHVFSVIFVEEVYLKNLFKSCRTFKNLREFLDQQFLGTPHFLTPVNSTQKVHPFPPQNQSVQHKCVSFTRHFHKNRSVTHKSLSYTQIGQLHTNRSVTHKSVSNTHLDQLHTNRSVTHKCVISTLKKRFFDQFFSELCNSELLPLQQVFLSTCRTVLLGLTHFGG